MRVLRHGQTSPIAPFATRAQRCVHRWLRRCPRSPHNCERNRTHPDGAAPEHVGGGGAPYPTAQARSKMRIVVVARLSAPCPDLVCPMGPSPRTPHRTDALAKTVAKRTHGEARAIIFVQRKLLGKCECAPGKALHRSCEGALHPSPLHPVPACAHRAPGQSVAKHLGGLQHCWRRAPLRQKGPPITSSKTWRSCSVCPFRLSAVELHAFGASPQPTLRGDQD